MANDKLEMKFNPNTISHLGIQMYSTLPPVLAELVSNSYDADAHEVILALNDSDINNKTISISDDGHGMTFSEINDCFLLIGRNRRGTDSKNQRSRSGKRFVIGKKGIGKLAFFGIAQTITITTVSEGLKNTFKMDWNELQKCTEIYRPKIIEKNVKCESSNGTSITLSNIKRKSSFTPDEIAVCLAKTFSIFDPSDFKVIVKYNDANDFIIDNKLKFNGLEEYKSWVFPLTNDEYDYSLKGEIKGKIIASKKTVPEKMRGIALFSRGKLVNEHSFFDVTATSFGYSYITGWLDIDFIDEWIPDVISTNRQSLNWEDERCEDLKHYLEAVITQVYKEHKESIEQNKKDDIKKKTGVDIDEWIDELPNHDKNLAKKLVKAIVSNDGIENDKAAELTSFVKDSFQFTSFKEMAAELKDNNASNADLLTLLNEWQLIEAREMYKLSEVRIETIKKFKENIDNDAKEVPVMHNFFKNFPWLLDPRIMNFQDEVRYSDLLKKHYVESEEIPENDRRLDFLCQDFAETFFIIELKRPGKVITDKELLQALDYASFIRSQLGNTYGHKIVCYVIGNRLSKDDSTKELAESLASSSKVYLKTYSELLTSASNYHKEFIEKYELMKKRT